MQRIKRLVIDGHNLIPKIPGVNLQDAEDENKLIEMLNEYCRLSRNQVEVFFDGAPAPANPSRKSGLVHAHFIRIGLTADDAIIDFVRRQHSPNHLLTVVSSDHRVRLSGKRCWCFNNDFGSVRSGNAARLFQSGGDSSAKRKTID